MSCKDASAIREAKLYVQGLHPENLLTKIVVATPPWEPSDEKTYTVMRQRFSCHPNCLPTRATSPFPFSHECYSHYSIRSTAEEFHQRPVPRILGHRNDLVKVRKKAGGDAAKISRAFRHILKKDRSLYGVDNYQIDDTIDALQQDVDNIIEAATITTVTSDNDVEGGEDEKHSQNNNEIDKRAGVGELVDEHDPFQG
ncbi:hypothetical protein C8F04DRAFT_1267478 [Mycena alexandri]|uniref:Uncharacterized protein n=1 Tax=Mycena alexandri TaxID=1745969 RepID=A0AAD6SG45_9AGAR|nr:hypothetical protein C8F04DRAFT_1267478 [Mycena alexandri]